jgi:hypothetical protein
MFLGEREEGGQVRTAELLCVMLLEAAEIDRHLF